jgi:hypothetical protein
MRDPWIFVSTELGGKTFGECVEVAMTRGAFWNVVITSRKLARPLFNSWGMRTGIYPAAASVAWLRRILADRPEFSDIAVSTPSENPGFQFDKLRAVDETPDAERAEDLHKMLEFLATLGCKFTNLAAGIFTPFVVGRFLSHPL